MVYQYVAYNEGGQVVRGRVTAATEEAASQMLTYAGYRTVLLKPYSPLVSSDKLTSLLYKVKPNEVILFYRQLAMLLESGTNIAASLELLQQQTDNRLLKKVLKEAIAEIRGGNQLSTALGKHPKVFTSVYTKLLGVGEKSGDLEGVLKQVADYLEKQTLTAKETKNALTYPVIVFFIAIIVVAVLVIFVFPAFAELYTSLGAELPLPAKMMMTFSDLIRKNGLFVLLALVAVAIGGYAYIRTPRGRFQMDRLVLKLPLLGRVKQLNELSRCCRSMSLLFRSGLPLTETIAMARQGSSNRVVAEALADVHRAMVKGEGLSQPMSKNKLFLPMMVQMVRVGEETGNLETTLLAVAQSYETEAADKTRSLIAMIQPAMTLGMGIVITLVAVSLFSTIFSMTSAAGL